jgi:protein SCO1
VMYNLTRPQVWHGSVINPPVPATDFVLTSGDGSPYRLSENNGKVRLLFFGFTNCPGACPRTLAVLKQMKAQLGSQASKVQVVLVTVDPNRDTPERMQTYVHAFHPDFVGLTGTEEELDEVWRAYGVYREIAQPGASTMHGGDGQEAGGYMVDHSTFVYLIDADGNLRETFSLGTAPEDITHDVRAVLRE